MRLWHGDCLELMKNIPDKSVDMVLCDLPYGITPCRWDKSLDFKALWSEYARLIRPDGAICLFGIEPFASLLRCSNLEMYKYDWVWQKVNASNFLAKKYQPGKLVETISVFGKMATSYSTNGNMKYFPQMTQGKPYTQTSGKQKTQRENSSVRSPLDRVVTKNEGLYYPNNVLIFKRDKCKLHPTQKPVPLLEYLIRTYTSEGDVVLDNCMGSGSTGVACVNTGRRFIGIEIDAGYFATAKKRIEAAQMQGRLF